MGILVTGSLVIAGIGLSRMDMINTALNSIVYEKSARVSLVKDIKALFYLQMMNEKNFILEETHEGMQTVEVLMTKRHEEMLKKIADLSEISTETGKAEMVKFNEIYISWWDLTKQVRQHALKGDDKKAMELSHNQGSLLRKAGEALINSTVERNEKRMLEDAVVTENDYKHARMLMIITSIFAIGLGLGVASLVLAALSKAINRVIENLTSSSDQVSAASQQIASLRKSCLKQLPSRHLLLKKPWQRLKSCHPW